MGGITARRHAPGRRGAVRPFHARPWWGAGRSAAACSGAPRLGPAAPSPGAPTSARAAWWTQLVSHVSGPGRDFDSRGSGRGGEAPSAECQLVARFPGWAGAIRLSLLRKLACSRVCPRTRPRGGGRRSGEAPAGSGVSRCVALFAAWHSGRKLREPREMDSLKNKPGMARVREVSGHHRPLIGCAVPPGASGPSAGCKGWRRLTKSRGEVRSLTRAL